MQWMEKLFEIPQTHVKNEITLLKCRFTWKVMFTLLRNWNLRENANHAKPFKIKIQRNNCNVNRNILSDFRHPYKNIQIENNNYPKLRDIWPKFPKVLNKIRLDFSFSSIVWSPTSIHDISVLSYWNIVGNSYFLFEIEVI